MRPLPACARLITLPQALAAKANYYCIITHNVADLLDVRDRREPRIRVLHHSLEGRIEEEGVHCHPDAYRDMLRRYVDLVGAHVVATSMFKGESWGFTDDIVQFGIDVNEYLPYSGEKACGLRICNSISSRRKILRWDLHEQALRDIPVTLVGHNPDIPGVEAAHDWDHLKKTLNLIASTSTRPTRVSRPVTTWPVPRRWRPGWPCSGIAIPLRLSNTGSPAF
jgi:hypothetical protein